MENVTEATTTDAVDAELEAILSGADSLFEDEIEETVAAEAIADDGDAAEALDDAVVELEMEEARAEAYEEQDEVTKPEPVEAATKPVVEAKPKTPRVKTAGMKPSEVIRTKLGDKVYECAVLEMSWAEASEEDLKESVDSFLDIVDTLPKKVGEKVANVMHHVNAGVQLSVYTDIAIRLLKEKGGFTTADLRGKYLARPYSAGTANAQSSQMSSLLPTLKIATRSGNTLTLNEDSLLAQVLCPEVAATE